MCMVSDIKQDRFDASEKLARLMEKELGYVDGHIDHIALRLFIQSKWHRVTHLAHAIHDDHDA